VVADGAQFVEFVRGPLRSAGQVNDGEGSDPIGGSRVTRSCPLIEGQPLRFFEPDFNFGAGGLLCAVIWARATLRELFHDFCQAIDFGVDSGGCPGRCFGIASVILRPDSF